MRYDLVKVKGDKASYEAFNPPPGAKKKLDLDCRTGEYKIHSPVALDLDGSGAIETTGASTAKVRNGSDPVGRTVDFDIDGDGTAEAIEWLSGGGDGLLVDNRDGNAASSMSGARLFGDQGGMFGDGYAKLATLDGNGDGQLSGAELDGLQVWVDDGDAVVEEGELRSLGQVGVSQISTQRGDVTNARGETLMQSNATRNGEQILTEDVWFAQGGSQAS